jgi:hypothetical protein
MATPLEAWARRESGGQGEEPVEAPLERRAVRVSKQGVLYLHVLPDERSGMQTQYQCRDCPMFIEDAGRR